MKKMVKSQIFSIEAIMARDVESQNIKSGIYFLNKTKIEKKSSTFLTYNL